MPDCNDRCTTMIFLGIIITVQKILLEQILTLIDKNSAIPYYLQLTNMLREQICSGIYKLDALLPSERKLGKHML